MTIYLRFGLLIMSSIDSIGRGYGRPDVHTRDRGEVVDLWIPLAMMKLFLLPRLTTTTTTAADIIILNDVNISVVSTHSLQNVRRVGMTES